MSYYQLQIDFTNREKTIRGNFYLLIEQLKIQTKQPIIYKQWKIKKWLNLDQDEIEALNNLFNDKVNMISKMANQVGSDFNFWIFSCQNHYLATPFNYYSFEVFKPSEQQLQITKITLRQFLKLVPNLKYCFQKNLIDYSNRIDYEWNFTNPILSDFPWILENQHQYRRQSLRSAFKEQLEKARKMQILAPKPAKKQDAHIINFTKLVKANNYEDAINPYNCLQIDVKIHQLWDQHQLILKPNGDFVDYSNQIVATIDLATIAKPTWKYLKLYWKTIGMQPVRTRYAPSPTGMFHIGGARSALFNYLFAKHYGGQVIFRLEDTDLNRNLQNGEQVQKLGCEWLGIEFDEAPWIKGCNQYRQSERLGIYYDYAKQLIAKGFAYQDPNSQAVIFKNNPNRNWIWNDLVRQQISFKGQTLRDWIIIKSNGYPTYNFAVVVDDHKMEISHIFRGEEHISNTPYQLMIYDALEWEVPQFGHLNLIINENGKKLSKRDDNYYQQAISYYQEQGYSPKALVNALVQLGWTSGTKQEFYDLEQLIKIFDVRRLNRAPAQFDQAKIDWFAKHYFQDLKIKTLTKAIKWDHSLKSNQQKQQLVIAYKNQCRHLRDLETKVNLYLSKLKEPVHKVDLKQLRPDLVIKLKRLNLKTFKINTFNKWLKQIDKRDWKTIRKICASTQQGPELAIALWLEGIGRWEKRFDFIKWKSAPRETN